MVAVDLLQAQKDIDNVRQGLEQGLVRVELIASAIQLLSKAQVELYRRKQPT